MLSTGQIRAVRPVDLARLTGTTKIAAFSASPNVPVVRPQLLSAQLRGCTCGDLCAPATLGEWGEGSDGSFGIFKMMSSQGMGGLGFHSEGLGFHSEGLGSFIPPDYGHTHPRWVRPRVFHHGGMGYLAQDGTDTTPVTTITPDIYSSAPGPSTQSSTVSQAIQNAASQIASIPVPSAGSGATSILNSVAAGASFIPGIGPVAGGVITAVSSMVKALQNWIGKGRQEADLIVPVQNNMVAQLGTITNQFLTGMSVSSAQLVSLYQQVWMIGVAFQEFVLQSRFTDRRASGQALNTVMPYIDGSCGYAVPVKATAFPSSQNCLRWGDGSLGGGGTNGMLGALQRAIAAAGGQAPVMPDLHATANSGLNPQSVQPAMPGIGSTAIPGVTGISALTSSSMFPIIAIGVIALLFLGGGGGGGSYKTRRVTDVTTY